MTPTLRVDPEELRAVAAGLPGPGGVGLPGPGWAGLPGPDGVGLPGSGWACLPALAAVMTAIRARVEELAGEVGWLAAGLHEAAGAYDEADDRAAARAVGAPPRARW